MTDQPLSAPSEDAPRFIAMTSDDYKAGVRAAQHEIATLRAALARVEQERANAIDVLRQIQDERADVIKAERAAERDSAQAQIAALTTRAEQADARLDETRRALAHAQDFARDLATNFDCDHDAHHYNTTCRACEAALVAQKLAAYLAQPSAAAGTRGDDGVDP